ncbi:RNA-binding protein, partial [Vibrio sp. D173a]|uniref:RNA recognition motif domain-containing protein n=1 Tax=Vibrio sp. D173a TaxID=2836349 RepID=UPI0025552FC6
AVLGGIVFAQVEISPAITFVLGVLASAFILNLSSSDTKSDSEPKASTQTLYVGNLPYKANGEVFAVRLMKDKRTGKRRGFGFVVMASNDVNNAIASLNDKDYMQRTLKVRVANDPKHPEADGSEQA